MKKGSSVAFPLKSVLRANQMGPSVVMSITNVPASVHHREHLEVTGECVHHKYNREKSAEETQVALVTCAVDMTLMTSVATANGTDSESVFEEAKSCEKQVLCVIRRTTDVTETEICTARSSGMCIDVCKRVARVTLVRLDQNTAHATSVRQERPWNADSSYH